MGGWVSGRISWQRVRRPKGKRICGWQRENGGLCVGSCVEMWMRQVGAGPRILLNGAPYLPIESCASCHPREVSRSTQHGLAAGEGRRSTLTRASGPPAGLQRLGLAAMPSVGGPFVRVRGEPAATRRGCPKSVRGGGTPAADELSVPESRGMHSWGECRGTHSWRELSRHRLVRHCCRCRTSTEWRGIMPHWWLWCAGDLSWLGGLHCWPA